MNQKATYNQFAVWYSKGKFQQDGYGDIPISWQ